MQYKDALNVQVGDLLYLKHDNYRETRVLRIDHNRLHHLITYHCTGGSYLHKEVILPLHKNEISKNFLQNPDTRVYISLNRGSDGHRYKVVVEDSNGFWLDAFETKEKAEQFISEHHLNIAIRRNRQIGGHRT